MEGMLTEVRVPLRKTCPAGAQDFGVAAAAVEGDTLTVVTWVHSGGCNKHKIGVCWEGGTSGASPPEVSIKLLHEDGNDSCKALVNEKVTVDLTRVRAQVGAATLRVGGETIAYTPS